MVYNCARCGKEFTTYPAAVKRGRRFCSASCARLTDWDRRGRREDGEWYRSLKLPDHPLADAYGVVREHRVVLYAKIGPRSHPCHWCGTIVTWRTIDETDRSAMLVVDHIDTDKRNNAPDNLVPSCVACNNNRGRSDIVRDDEVFIVGSSGKRTRAAERTCEICGTKFLKALWDLRRPEWGRFCSLKCSGIGKRKAQASCA